MNEWLQQINWHELNPLWIAGLLGAIVGTEREVRRKPAGLRTNILIAVGAAMFTAMARTIVNEDASTRIIQGIITGVGFIGGGVLIRQGGSITGMTTAATIWLVTGIGVACGMCLYEMAVAVTVLALVVLWGLSPLDKRLRKYENDHHHSEKHPDQ